MYFGLFCFCAAVYVCELKERERENEGKTTVQHNKNNLISLVRVFQNKPENKNQ